MAAVRLAAAIALALALAAQPAAAQLDRRTLADAVARPPADARLPATLRFHDARGGGAVTLGGVASGRPLVLLFADYTCRHICGPGLSLTAAALHDTGLRPGRDYALAVVGLDPRDDADAARAFADRIADPAVRRAAAMLAGTPASVATATRTLGYGTAYDAGSDQFAHDASVYVFAPDGRLAALLPELGLRPEGVRAALTGAAAPPTLGERVARLCYGLGAAHGRYGGTIVAGLQVFAALTAAGAAMQLWRARRA